VSLTSGRGPLSANPSGRFLPPLTQPTVYIEPFRRRVRGTKNDAVLVDSEEVLLVHRPGHPPAFAFPSAHVADGLAVPLPEVDGYVTVPWDSVNAWYEEEEQIFLHPRNPYHRVDYLRTSRRLRVQAGGTVLVDSDDTVAVYETALEPRLYVRRDQLAGDFLVPNPNTTTYCPYKGTASYWNAVIGSTLVENAAWSYEEAFPEATAIKGLISFDESRVAVVHNLPPAASPW
jgi:uncharacterized protein (DUF427 family)